MDSLIERLEKADGPDRALFVEVFEACFPEPAADCEPRWRPETPRQPIYHAWKTREIQFMEFVRVAAWESAALTLVPDGFGMELFIYPDGTANCVMREWSPPCRQAGCVDVNTPALAICLAALKARVEFARQALADLDS